MVRGENTAKMELLTAITKTLAGREKRSFPKAMAGRRPENSADELAKYGPIPASIRIAQEC
jgi:hypothetical protein